MSNSSSGSSGDEYGEPSSIGLSLDRLEIGKASAADSLGLLIVYLNIISKHQVMLHSPCRPSFGSSCYMLDSLRR